jgi:stage V sporulation protein G
MIVSEIQITPIKPSKGLIGFASFVLYGTIYCSSVGIHTRIGGGYRLTFPYRKVGNRDIYVFYPTNKELGDEIERAVSVVFEDVMSKRNARYGSSIARHF